MFKKILISVIFIFCIENGITQYISQKKCNEYSTIQSSKQHPYSVAMGALFENTFYMSCSGVMISEKYTLGLASCYHYGTSGIPVMIITDTNINLLGINQYGQTYTISETINHPLYVPGQFNHNLALYKFNGTISLNANQRPLCIYPNKDPMGGKIVLAEWGRDDIGTTAVRQETLVNEMKNTDCTVPDSFICVQKPDNKSISLDAVVNIVRSENNFLFGMKTRFFDIESNNVDNLDSLTRISPYINWIETNVWPEEHNCGHQKIKPDGVMTNEFEAHEGQFPWHVAISEIESVSIRNYICDGYLISSKHVLTAAHCIVSSLGVTLSPYVLVIELGKQYIYSSSLQTRLFAVNKVIPHVNFNLTTLENDIGILKLDVEVSFTNFFQPICLSSPNLFFNDEVGIVSGWGNDIKNKKVDELYWAYLSLISQDKCQQNNQDIFKTILYGKNFCAKYRNDTSVCTGISGGGMIIKNIDQWYLKGIVSLSNSIKIDDENQCDLSQFIVFTDVVPFFDWIQSKIN